MGKLDAFFEGMLSIFNIAPKSKYHKANYLKPVPLKSHSDLNSDKNCIAQNMQKILTQDLGNALNQVKGHLDTSDREQFDKLSRLHKETEKYYNKAKKKK